MEGLTLKEKLTELEALRAEDIEYLELIKEYYPTAKMEKVEKDNGYELIIHWYDPDINKVDGWKHTEVTKEYNESTWIPIPNLITTTTYPVTYPTANTVTSTPYSAPYYTATTGTSYTSNNSYYEDKISTLESKVEYLMGAINGKTM